MELQQKDAQRAKKEFLSAIGLIIASIFWGLSYPMTKFVEDCPTFFIISLRFLTATVVLAIIFHKHFRNFNWSTLKHAFLLSFFLTAMFIFNVIGVKHTTAIRAGFFTTFTFILVPVMNWALFRQKISKRLLFSIVICLIGMYCLCYVKESGGFVLNSGDILCIFACAASGFYIIFMERVAQKENIDLSLYTVFLMFFIALTTSIVGAFTGELFYTGCTGVQLVSIIAMGIFCSGVAFTLQSFCEEYVPANNAGVIFALEPVSGCILSLLIIGERISLVGWVGIILITLSVIYLQFGPGSKTDK